MGVGEGEDGGRVRVGVGGRGQEKYCISTNLKIILEGKPSLHHPKHPFSSTFHLTKYHYISNLIISSVRYHSVYSISYMYVSSYVLECTCVPRFRLT